MTAMKALVLAAVLALNLAACATVQHGPLQRVHVDSEPSGADVLTTLCGPGSTKKARTPGVIWVSRRAERCTVLVSADGYESERVVLTRAVANEYFDNLSWLEICGPDALDCVDDWPYFFFGGLLAGTGFGVDAVTGALYEQQPDDVFVTLEPLPEP